MGRKVPAHQADRELPRLLFGLPLVALPTLLGGARPWLWSVIAGVFAANLAWSLSSGHRQGWTSSISRQWAVGLGLLLLYPLFQILPLPASWLTHMSPLSVMWRELADHFTQTSSRFFSISYSPLVTFFASLWWLFLVGYALLFRQFLRDMRNLVWFCRLLFLVAGVEAFYGLMQTLIPSLGVLWESEGQGVARGTFVNRNHYAAFLGMIWPSCSPIYCARRQLHLTLPIPPWSKQRRNVRKAGSLGSLSGWYCLGWCSRCRGEGSWVP